MSIVFNTRRTTALYRTGVWAKMLVEHVLALPSFISPKPLRPAPMSEEDRHLLDRLELAEVQRESNLRNAIIDIGRQFGSRLLYRSSEPANERTRSNGGIEFRMRFMSELETPEFWSDKTRMITLDFKNVDTLGPAWANEVFAYWAQCRLPADVKNKIKCINITEVKQAVIDIELDHGYCG